MSHSSKFGMLVRDPKGFTYTKKSTLFLPSQSQSVKPQQNVLMQIIPFVFSFQENIYLSDGK